MEIMTNNIKEVYDLIDKNKKDDLIYATASALRNIDGEIDYHNKMVALAEEKKAKAIKAFHEGNISAVWEVNNNQGLKSACAVNVSGQAVMGRNY